jgi:hypothetical protein
VVDLGAPVRERPIIMTAESVRAILAGTKTQTRRVAKPEEFGASEWKDLPTELADSWNRFARPRHPRFGDVGDRLWVKEAWQAWRQTNVEHDEWEIERDSDRMPGSKIEYRATSQSMGPWRPPLFMPRWASRMTLEVTQVRVQQLHEISDDDARAEGVEPYTHISPDQCVPGPGFDGCRLGDQPHRLPFSDRWDAINGKRRRSEWTQLGERGYPGTRTVLDESARWARNPWVWAVTMKVVK